MDSNKQIPQNIADLSVDELPATADTLREKIIDAVATNGGHLSANLGVVELTLALTKVFDPKKDKILFDVGHQCYAYKLLTGRDDNFSTLRQQGGISGFQSSAESVCDPFTTGHAGNSVALSLGFCKARDVKGEDGFVVDVIGDGSIANGMALEAMVACGEKPDKLLVVLNDNGMAISKNRTGLYRAISKMTVRSGYTRFKRVLKTIARAKWLYGGLVSFRDFVKRSLNHNNMFDEWGLKYVGPVDGHNLTEMVRVLENIKTLGRPTLLHVITKKGKGLCEAEDDSAKYHGVGKNLVCGVNTFSEAVSPLLCDLKREDDRIQCVTAAMCDGVGLKGFAEQYPAAYTDAGIAEAYAVTLSAAMAKAGLRPFVFLYSTFLQRAYDQVVEEVALENLPLVLMIDRAGLVGNDGVTHQGIFDLAYLGHIPNLSIFAPKDAAELSTMARYAKELGTPVAIRYENGENPLFATHTDLSQGLWERVSEGSRAVVLAVGGRMLRLAEKAAEKLGGGVEIVNCRTVKPLDTEYLATLGARRVVTLEDGVVSGGFGERVAAYLATNANRADIKILGIPDGFVPHASTAQQLASCGLTVDAVVSAITNE